MDIQKNIVNNNRSCTATHISCGTRPIMGYNAKN